jgi:replicative DNA helicase
MQEVLEQNHVSVEAEQAVLGAMLLDNAIIDAVSAAVTADAFFLPEHQLIFSTIQKLYGKYNTVDLISLTEKFQKDRNVRNAGGRAYIASLLENVATSSNTLNHTEIIKSNWLMRAIKRTILELHEETDIADNPFKLLDYIEQKISRLREEQIDNEYISFKTALDRNTDYLEALDGRGMQARGLKTGFSKIDAMTCGLQDGELTLLAGRPSMGKTAFALNIARNVAMDGKPVGFFSMEMNYQALCQRLMSAEAQIDSMKMRALTLSQEDWDKYMTKASKIVDMPLYIDDSPALTILDLRSKARRMSKERNIKLIVIDYLQMLKTNQKMESRQQEVAMFARSLKALAKELKLPVLALSQLSRQPEQRGRGKRPILSDLRESGELEQTADVVMFVYREEMYKPQDEKVRGVAEIIIGKQRNGPIGTCELQFQREFTKFNEIDRRYGEEPYV